LETLRETNRQRVLEALRAHGLASRNDLAQSTGLSRSTVTTLVSELQADGVVAEVAGDAGVERSGRGRPPSYLKITPKAGAVLGVDFGHRHVRVAVGDLSCQVLAERCVDAEVDTAAATALDAATRMIDEVLAEAGLTREQVIGAGLGLPGPIDATSGAVGSSVILPDWAGLRPADELSRRIAAEVVVDNDANLGALAEATLGAGRGAEDLIYLKVSSGIGAGLVLGGRLYRGATGIAGEIGHVQVQPDGVVCRCGSRGCLETVAATPALLRALAPAHRPDLTVRDLIELTATGDLGARRVIVDAGRMIGRAVGDLCNSLNPSAIVIGGDLVAAGQPLLEGVTEGVSRHAQPGAAQAVTTRLGTLGDRAQVLGALVLAVGEFRTALAGAG